MTKLLGQVFWLAIVAALAVGIFAYFWVRREVHATVTIPEDEIIVRRTPVGGGLSFDLGSSATTDAGELFVGAGVVP